MGSVLIIRDDTCLEFVAEKMQGTMLLDEGVTEADDIEEYKSYDHINAFIDEGQGFLCLSIHENFVYVHYAWHEGKRSTQKQMVKLGKELYRRYRVQMGLSMYYSGQRNFYKHHSREVSDGLWIFEPKDYD